MSICQPCVNFSYIKLSLS